MVPGGSLWLFLVVCGSWWFLIFLVVLGGSCGLWWLLVVLCGSLWFLAVLGGSWC